MDSSIQGPESSLMEFLSRGMGTLSHDTVMMTDPVGRAIGHLGTLHALVTPMLCKFWANPTKNPGTRSDLMGLGIANLTCEIGICGGSRFPQGDIQTVGRCPFQKLGRVACVSQCRVLLLTQASFSNFDPLTWKGLRRCVQCL